MAQMSYNYTKERREFGRQCHFSDKSQMLVSMAPNRDLFKDFILRNPVSRSTETPRQLALSVCNTESVEFDSRGLLHNEGGWPKVRWCSKGMPFIVLLTSSKDTDKNDPEQTVRYKRKIEKDENYISQVLTLAKVSGYIFFFARVDC